MELDQIYKDHLNQINEAIQASEELAAYLDTEEQEEYKALQEMFEPSIDQLYQAVAESQPLQLMSLEQELLHDDYAGLYLPKILGYSVLRGQIDNHYNYVRPENQFRDILSFICNSPNFDILKTKIGQSVQIGFSLSSDIWVTNLIKSVHNKKVKWWLQNQKLHELRDISAKKSAYQRYKIQFRNANYLSTEFPSNPAELKIIFGMIRDFMIYRIAHQDDNVSLYQPITAMLMNEELKGSDEYTYILGLFLNYFELNEDYKNVLAPIFNQQRKDNDEFTDQYLRFLLDLHERKTPALDAAADRRIIDLMDVDIEDDLTNLYASLKVVHNKGYINEEVMGEVRRYHNSYQGLSDNNECIRQSILVYVRTLMDNLEPSDYSTWFDMHKVFNSYINIFGNEQFKQEIKNIDLRYLRQCLKTYTDKRGGDYQNVKKFTTATFKEMNFMKEKHIKELFVTKRKKRPTPQQ